MTVRVQIRAETFLGKVLGIRRRLKITVYIAPMKRFDALARIHCRSVVRKTVANCKMIDSKTSKVFPLACHADFHVYHANLYIHDLLQIFRRLSNRLRGVGIKRNKLKRENQFASFGSTVFPCAPSSSGVASDSIGRSGGAVKSSGEVSGSSAGVGAILCSRNEVRLL